MAEATEVAPWLAARLLRSAAQVLPPQHRDRYELEWLGEMDAVPGKLFKLLFAVRITLRVPATRRELERAEAIWVLLGRRLLAGVITAALAVAHLASRLLIRMPMVPPKHRPDRTERHVGIDAVLTADRIPNPSEDLAGAIQAWLDYGRPKRWVNYSNSLPIDAPIERLDLSVRTYNSLKRAGALTISDLVDMAESNRQLLRIRNFGRASLDELQEKLTAAGWDHESWE